MARWAFWIFLRDRIYPPFKCVWKGYSATQVVCFLLPTWSPVVYYIINTMDYITELRTSFLFYSNLLWIWQSQRFSSFDCSSFSTAYFFFFFYNFTIRIIANYCGAQNVSKYLSYTTFGVKFVLKMEVTWKYKLQTLIKNLFSTDSFN